MISKKFPTNIFTQADILNVDNYTVKEICEGERSTIVSSSKNFEFKIPFVVGTVGETVKLVRRKNGKGHDVFSMLTQDKTGYNLNQRVELTIKSLNKKVSPLYTNYFIDAVDDKNQLLSLKVDRVEFLNLSIGKGICCTINKIYPNKLFLNLNFERTYKFSNDLDYSFNIVERNSAYKPSIGILNLEYRDEIFELIVPAWQCFYMSQLKAIVGRVQNEYSLLQDFHNLIHPIFEIDRIYNFVFVADLDDSPAYILVTGIDGCYYTVRKPFIYQNKDIVSGTIIRLVYKGINETNGNIKTKFFVPFEDILPDFRALKRITFDTFKKEIIEEDDILKDLFIVNKLYQDYDNFENLWIISFCEVLRNKINQSLFARDFEGSLIFIDVLVMFEEWILNSGFLLTFSPKKRESSAKVALLEIDKFKKEAQALELLLDKQEEQFIEKLIQDLDRDIDVELLMYKAYISFYIIKHQYFALDDKIANKYLQLIFSIGKRGIFKKDISLYTIVVPELDRLKLYYDKNLFYQVFINSDKRKSYYAGNPVLLEAIKHTYISLLIQTEFSAYTTVYFTTIRLFRLIGLYSEDIPIQKNYFSKAVSITDLTIQDVTEKVMNVMYWSLDETHILNFDFIVPLRKKLKNEIDLTNSLKNSKSIEARVVGNSFLGYELMFKEDILILPFFNTYRKYRRGEVIQCVVYKIDTHFSQVLVKTIIDKSNIPTEQSIELDSTIIGIVKRIEPFGAFVNLGIKDGLIPKKEVSEQYLERVEDILEIGDEVVVKVIKIEKEGDIEKITLSRKLALIEANAPKHFESGSYKAIITSIREEYGIFIEIENGTSGLINYDEVSWNGYAYLKNLYNPGDAVIVKYLRSIGNKHYFSLKRNIADPFLKKNIIPKTLNAKVVGILNFDNWLEEFDGDFRPISDENRQLCYCPYCYEKSLYRRHTINLTSTRSLEKLDKDRFWRCTECKFFAHEVIEVFIPELYCYATWPLQNLTSAEYKKVTRHTNRNDELQLRIIRIDYLKRKLFFNVILDSLKKATLKKEIGSFEKYVSHEIACCYEAYGFLEDDLERKWNYLELAKYYYGASKSAKSYYLDVYVNFIKILNSIIRENALENTEGSILKIKSLIADIELESNAIETFPVIEKIITLLKVFSQYGSKSEAALKYLLTISIAESIEHDYVKDLAAAILSYNLQMQSTNDVVTESLRNRILGVLKSCLNSFENFEANNEEIKKKILVQKLLEKGEKIDVEFKASLQVPVLSKELKKEIKKITEQLKVEEDPNVKAKLGQQLFERQKISVNDKILVDRVNFVAMKTIAAFANTHGGYLVIGIDEDADGNPVLEGLRPDYIKYHNSDNLLLRLDELMQKYFGNSLITILLSSVDFVSLMGKEVLLLTVNKIDKPIFLNYNNDKKFYIRRQASSVELTAYELYEYINSKLINENEISSLQN